MIDYEILRLIWWALLGILLGGFAVMDGFDLGIAGLLPSVAKTDLERRVVLNTVGPVWEGNQVWFILGGGAIFAAWPYLYAVSFSGFYLAMFLVLVTFIVRPVAFKYRSKITHSVWRAVWDWSLCIAGLISALIFGVAVGNVLQGVPFYFDGSLRAFYTGGFWELLNPFALLCGLISILMMRMQGGLFLAIKTEGDIHQRAIIQTRIAAILLISLFALAGVWIAYGIKGFVLIQGGDPHGPSNPLHKVVAEQMGAWLINYSRYPWMLAAPVIGFLGAILAFLLVEFRHSRIAFICSSLSILGIIATAGFSMFPFLLPSSSTPNSSLIVWDASSSQLTLQIMLISTIIFLPLILLYTTWIYRVLRGKVTENYVDENQDSMY